MPKPDDNTPKKKTLYTLELPDDQLQALKAWCDKQLWAFYEVDHAQFAFKGTNVNLVAYNSGKLVIQGKGTEDFVQFVLEPEITHTPLLGYDEFHNPEYYEHHAGLDESGKGDLFGPLTTACVIADGDIVKQWQAAGIQDSKKITSDAAILKFDAIIRKTKGATVKTMSVNMLKYNELYDKFGRNLNKLLAWMHSKSLEAALEENPTDWGMLDQFSKKPLVQAYFEHTDFDLRMQTKAEADPIVAAASIAARAVYVRAMEQLSDKAGFELSKGASKKVKEQGRVLVQKFGPEALPEYAKMHFKTASEVLASV